jgi:RNA polymerase sigma-70 factor (ECF subfamily)
LPTIHKRHSSAEDIMIIAFMKVFTNLKELSVEVSKVGLEELWLMNVFPFIQWTKSWNSEEENYFEESFNNIESQFSIADIQYLIDSLPDGYKMVFNLYAIEGYKHQEIASMLGINEGTSKSQCHMLEKCYRDRLTS